MEIKELRIIIPENREIDWQESAKQEKIVFKKKNTKPRSWEEYCHTRLDSKETRFGYSIGGNCVIYNADWDNSYNCSTWRNVLPSKELAEAFLAMMQLMSLRQDWIHKWSIDNGLADDWKPDREDHAQYKRCIVVNNNNIFNTESFYGRSHPLSFPTKEMAEDFLNTFKDLLEVAKPLL